MDIENLETIVLAKYLFTLAKSNIRTENKFKRSMGMNLLQDSVETFLFAIAEHSQITLHSTRFDDNLRVIDEKVQLSVCNQLKALNKARVSSKHFATIPEEKECYHFMEFVEKFMDETSKKVFGKSIVSITLLDAIEKGELRDVLVEAENNHIKKKYRDCLINCRKALYLGIEWHYNIELSDSENPLSNLPVMMNFDKKQPGLLPFMMMLTPDNFKKNIESYIKDPSYYNSNSGDSCAVELLQYGIDNKEFWNICRLTPIVIRRKKSKEWVVKYEYKQLINIKKENVEYVLNSTIGIMLAIQGKKEATKKLENEQDYYLVLKKNRMTIHEKASKLGSDNGEIETDDKNVKSDFIIKGLDDEEYYWHINDARYPKGYLCERDINLEASAKLADIYK